MKRRSLLPIIATAVIVLTAIGGIINKSTPEYRMSGHAYTPEDRTSNSVQGGQGIRYYSEDEIVATMEKNLEEYFPGRWSCSIYGKADRTVVDVRISSDTVAALRDLAQEGVSNMPQEWDKLVESMRAASGNWRDAFEMNRHYGYMVQFGYVDESAPEELVFYCVNGVTALDPVHGVDLMADVEAARAAASK